ncbi:Mediator of RNA polymerase II transcription subunit 13 [Lachancea thermotolerans]
MEYKETPYRLEDLLTSFYRVENINKINYVQYIPSKPDAQWSIQAELALRKHNPKILVSLFSRELWCFSINEEELPKLNLDLLGNPPSPEKIGYFTPNISKPNLPTAYAVFLKALRRKIHINICLKSHQRIIPFGNSCLYNTNEKTNKVIHFEPQLFENGDLCISICTKDVNLRSFNTKTINENFMKSNAIYLAPSGIRAYLVSSDIKKCVSPPPKSASVLLITLLVSHGIDLTKKKDITWVKVTPNLDHLNGYTPSISGYLDPPKATKTAIWPLELCFSQLADSLVSTQTPPSPCVPDLQGTFDIIDDFIQLKLTSAFKSPGNTCTGASMGTATGNEALSTGGTYGEQYQAFHKRSQSGSMSAAGPVGYQLGARQSPSINAANLTPANNKPASHPPDAYINGFLTTPNINESVDANNEDIMLGVSPQKLRSELWSEKKDSDVEFGLKLNTPVENTEISTASEKDDADLDAELFGDDNADDEVPGNSNLKGDENKQVEQGVKDITDEMFDMADESDSPKDKSEVAKQPAVLDLRRSPFKRKYLDIPLEEMTLPSTPLYTDPGAPLPVETPKDRKKSVFAPLNFNPIIESNVDNKYKNGGKFSFDGGKVEESLKFDVSTANVSSSEDDETGSSADEFDDMFTGGDNFKSTDVNAPTTAFAAESQIGNVPEFVQQDTPPLPIFDNSVNNEKTIRDNSLEMWKFSRDQSSQDFGSPKTHSSSSSARPSQFQIAGNGSNDLLKPNNTNPLLEQTSKSYLPINDNNVDSTNGVDKEIGDSLSPESMPTPESSNSLPFLLRHMPLFSIPDAFFLNNPSLAANDDLPSLLDLLCEQIVFDQGKMGDLKCRTATYNNFEACSDGVVKTTIDDIFSKFQRLHGGELIEEISPIRQPAVYVKKNDEVIKIKSDSEPFSQYLHLKPYKGIKSFKGLFLTTILKNDCLEFLSTMSQIYSSHELGFCELVKLTSADTPGLIYLVNLEESTLSLLSAQIVSYCSTNTLNTMSVPLVVFLPIMSSNLSEVVAMTLKFQFIKNEILSKLPSVKLCLKLIPLDFVKDPLTSIEEYYDFCVGIYNTLPPKSDKFTSIADEVPKKIEFRTIQKTNGQTSHFDVYIHLAYARSVDRNWICAAWSNSNGSENGVKTWYIGNSKNAFEDACNRMWRITLKFASNKYGRVCLVLSRFDSVLPDDELMHWRRLSSTSRNLHLAVVCVGDNTKVSLYDEDRIYPSFKPIFRDGRLSQKIDTLNLDNYEIVDIGSEIHGIVFRSPLHLANSQHRCAINTGALVRFKAADCDEILDKMEVNLLNCPHSDSTKLLKIILQEFRNLASLNPWFGISKSKDVFVPWHVLAVKKMLRTMVHLKVKDNP